jgi:hypothetical protein
MCVPWELLKEKETRFSRPVFQKHRLLWFCFGESALIDESVHYRKKYQQEYEYFHYVFSKQIAKPQYRISSEYLPSRYVNRHNFFNVVINSTTMAKYSKKSQDTVKSAMKRKKKGTLRSGSGKKVTSRKQAIAIGLSEARKKGAKVPAKKHSRSRPAAKRKTTKTAHKRKKARS